MTSAEPHCRHCRRPASQTELKELGRRLRLAIAFLAGRAVPDRLFECKDPKRCKRYRVQRCG